MQALVAAEQRLPSELPVSVLLFGEDAGTPIVPAYVALALGTGGALVTPSSDWQ